MSESLAIIGNSLPAITPEMLEKVLAAESRIMQAPQIDVQTEHILHGGMYARTVRLAAHVVIVGVLLKVPTVLIVQGSTLMLAGDKWYRLDGYQVMPAQAGRKQVFVTNEETSITMIFATSAKTVEEAEAEFTDETGKLLSRRKDGNDIVTVTGE